MGQFQRHMVGGGVNHLGGRRGGVGCGFSGRGDPCGERNTAFDSLWWCFGGEMGEGAGVPVSTLVVRTTMLDCIAGMAGPVAGTELIGELCAGGGCRAWRGAEAVPLLPLGHPGATAVSAAAGRLAHAVDDKPMRGLSACASGRAAPSLHPHTPAGKGRISKNGGRGSHPPPGGGRFRHGEDG